MQFVPRVFPLDSAGDPGELLSRLRSRRGLAALESAGVVAFDPLQGVATPSSIAGIGDALAAPGRGPLDEVPGRFRGGFLGALSYELGVAGERPVAVAPDPWRSPRVAGGLYVDFVVRDAERGAAWLVLGEDPGDGRPPVEVRRREILALLEGPAPRASDPCPIGPLVRATPREEHVARIEAARERIAAGDFYQANLAHRFTRAMEGDPVDLYRALRARHPAPHAGFLAFEGGAILSASPELLLDYDGELARTRPIKGTAARGATFAEDARRARELLESPKDRAELAMIVDLERNDLGRVCEPGSVRVVDHPRLESYATVHHLVADVVGRPLRGVGAVELLAALFPGGSITGAPKLAAMEAIARLEKEGRGFFTGSLGFLGLDGRAGFNILIRTLVWRPGAPAPAGTATRGEVSLHVGGGITWSSDARAEDDETLTKAAALLAALEGEEREPGKPRRHRASRDPGPSVR